MEGYVSEEQQVEAIKKWWKENGVAVVSGVVLGLGILFGGRAWFDYKQVQAENSSMTYSLMLQAVEVGKQDEAVQLGTALLADGNSGEYAAMASLMLARIEVERGALEKAQAHLQWVNDNASLTGLSSVATLRLARLLYMQGDSDAALAKLETVPSEGFASAYSELKGDIYAAKGEADKARAAYSIALATNGTSSFLQMKHDDLAAGDAK
ncbi:hypothetical protein BOW53_01055 [Solemya pervernicosa gill symbiont]|uniref:Ancillary SecYEG translocon subunit n=2 Tax=Gammaproteobacteria incertae sedis TaxID=118884 RepID=A0A1T2LAR2_9GAMM|nr:tetratricopeptide repeat protein [Candidatus Reidiella endopervernicosa]OOZ42198.1 hypothetical protein BOW53_01055 [Solemya pervernicosa gill symbiont]QKQ27234.1 tetratricopeptide repeat protein [Candidatus Reidiella endopervernicosa]